MSPPESPYQGHTRFAVYAVCDSLNWAGLYSDLGGKTNAWHLREIVRRLCEQRQKISTSADEQQDHAAQRGRDASEQRHASCASLFRRLSAFFGSAPNQGPKAAKFAVLIPGPGMFVNVQYVSRVVIAAPSGRPVFRRVSRCVRSFSESRVCAHFHS